MWTAGITSCNELEQNINAFPSNQKPTGFIFVLDLSTYKNWQSYIDLRFQKQNSIKCLKNKLIVSGCSPYILTKSPYQIKKENNENVWGTFYMLGMNDVFSYNDTSSIDTTKKDYEYYYYLDGDKLIITSKDSINNVSLYNLNGRELLRKKYYSNRIEINGTKYSSGVYFVIINEEKIYKILKE